MSSTFPHYAPLGSSVPNDYAIVAHFAGSVDGSAIDSDTEEGAEENVQGVHSLSPSSSPHRVLRHYPSTENPNGLRPGTGYGTSTSTSPSRGRRLSVPAGRRGPRRGSLDPSAIANKNSPVIEEHEPLLGDIPRLVEDDDTSTDEQTESWALWLQELKVVSKYTMPVFG